MGRNYNHPLCLIPPPPIAVRYKVIPFLVLPSGFIPLPVPLRSAFACC